MSTGHMKLPQRTSKHVSEADSYKVFKANIPSSWILRELPERDYGIDFYLELVNGKGQVTGDIVFLQIKSKNGINWNKKGKYSFAGIKISTAVYWNQVTNPVFIFLVDTKNQEVYFNASKLYMRQRIDIFIESYSKDKTMSFEFDRKNKFDIEDLNPFLAANLKQIQIKAFQTDAITFISCYEQYKTFITENIGKKEGNPIRMIDVLYLQHFYHNVHSLNAFFDMEWDLIEIVEFEDFSKGFFGADFPLYDIQLNIILEQLEKKLVPTMLALKKYICRTEGKYWRIMERNLYRMMLKVNKSGNIAPIHLDHAGLSPRKKAFLKDSFPLPFPK